MKRTPIKLLILIASFLSIINYPCYAQKPKVDIDAKRLPRSLVIAIIDTTGGEKNISNLAYLLTAKLSQEQGLRLVEREEIDKLISELELSAIQLTDRQNTLKLGKLLGADGLVFLSLSDNDQILRCRLVDTKYGLRLLDTLVEWKKKDNERGKKDEEKSEKGDKGKRTGSKIEQISKELVPRITKVCPKLLIPPGERVLVGILSIRNVDPSSRLNHLELSLPGVISSRLSPEPNIIVLEREDLNLVLEEKFFAGDKGENSGVGFLGSAVLFEGEIREIRETEQTISNEFNLNLKLKQADGTSIGVFDTGGDTENIPELIKEIAAWMIKTITNTPPKGSWDVKNESARFLKEGKMLMANGKYVAARSFLETAYALSPNNISCIESLTELIAIYLNIYLKDNTLRYNTAITFKPLKVAQDVRQLLELSSKNKFKKNRRKLYSKKILIYLTHASSVANNEVKMFNKDTRKYCDKLIQETDDHALIIDWSAAVSETPEEAIEKFKTAVNKRIEGIERLGKRLINVKGRLGVHEKEISKYCDPSQDLLFGWLMNSLNKYANLMSTAGHWDKEKTLNLCLDYLIELTESDNPTTKIIAELSLLQISMKEHKDYPVQTDFERMERIINILIKELNYPSEPFSFRNRFFLRKNIGRKLLLYRSTPEMWIKTIEKLLNPLIEKNDWENLLLWSSYKLFHEMSSLKKCSPETGRRILVFFDSLINVLENIDNDVYKNMISELKKGYRSIINTPEAEAIQIRAYRRKFLRRNPELKKYYASSEPDLKVSIICDITKHADDINKNIRIGFSEKPVIQNEILWIPTEDCIGLIGVNLKEKSLHSFWYTSLPDYAYYNKESGPGFTRKKTKPAVSKDAIYLGVWGKGIIKFPGTAKKGIAVLENPEIITEKDGLPSNKITGLAHIGKKLFISVGGGSEETTSGFGVYDLEKKQWQTISSSQSKDRSCPLNNERSYIISALTPAPDGKKLFFFCYQSAPGRDNIKRAKMDGFWKMNIKSGKLEHLWGPAWWGDIIPREGKWLIRTTKALIAFDPYLETSKFIAGNNKGNNKASDIKAISPNCKPLIREKMFIINEYGMDYWKQALFKDTFWTERGPGKEIWCYFLNQNKVKKIGPPDFLGENYISSLYPTPYGLVVLGEHKIGLIEENPELEIKNK